MGVVKVQAVSRDHGILPHAHILTHPYTPTILQARALPAAAGGEQLASTERHNPAGTARGRAQAGRRGAAEGMGAAAAG